MGSESSQGWLIAIKHRVAPALPNIRSVGKVSTKFLGSPLIDQSLDRRNFLV